MSQLNFNDPEIELTYEQAEEADQIEEISKAEVRFVSRLMASKPDAE